MLCGNYQKKGIHDNTYIDSQVYTYPVANATKRCQQQQVFPVPLLSTTTVYNPYPFLSKMRFQDSRKTHHGLYGTEYCIKAPLFPASPGLWLRCS